MCENAFIGAKWSCDEVIAPKNSVDFAVTATVHLTLIIHSAIRLNKNIIILKLSLSNKLTNIILSE
jgi:hypothetical protein